jgi:hypothetical protein
MCWNLDEQPFDHSDKEMKASEISGSHGDEYGDGCLLGCCAM